MFCSDPHAQGAYAMTHSGMTPSFRAEAPGIPASGLGAGLMAAILTPHCRPGPAPGPSFAGAARKVLDSLAPGIGAPRRPG